MSAVPAVPGIKVVKALERAGFEVTRISGSHHSCGIPTVALFPFRSIPDGTCPGEPYVTFSRLSAWRPASCENCFKAARARP